MLERGNRHSSQNAQSHQGSGVPFHRNGLGLTLGFPGVLPEPSDIGRGGAGVGVYQVARSYGASEIGRLRQVGSLVFGGKERSVSSWSSCTPGGVLLFSDIESQSPARIDSADALQRDVKGSKHVYYSNAFFAYLNPWLMESSPDQKDKQCCGGDACCNSPETGVLKASKKGEQHHGNHYVGNDLAKSRSKALHLHNDSLATGVFA